ncbi:50S ribosomal protein L4, partial [Bienertia sinuspersici]
HFKGTSRKRGTNSSKSKGPFVLTVISFLPQLSVHLANLRLKEASIDVFVTAYEPIVIKSSFLFLASKSMIGASLMLDELLIKAPVHI